MRSKIDVANIEVRRVDASMLAVSTVSPDLTPVEKVVALRYAAREALRQLRAAERDAGVVSVAALALDYC